MPHAAVMLACARSSMMKPPTDNRLARALRPYLELPRGIYIIFMATLVNGVGIFVFPFMTRILTKNLGMSASEAGAVIMLLSLAYLPGGLIGGKLADRFGRKTVMLATQIISVGALIPCGFMPASPAIIPFIVVSLLFDGITDPARAAMNMDLTTPENRQTAYSLLYLGHNLGFAAGPLIAGFLFNVAPQWLFWGNALAAGLASVLVLVLVPETKPSQAQIAASYESTSSERAERGGVIRALLSRPLLLAYVAISTWLSFAYAQHRFLLPLQTAGLFGSSGDVLYGLLMTTNAALVVVLNVPAVALFRRFGPLVNTALSGFLFAVGFGMLAFARTPWMFYLSTFLWTLGEILNATNSDVYVANHTPLSHRGRFNAVLPFIWGLGWALATPVSGLTVDSFGIPATWLIVGAVAFLASVGVLGLSAAERRTSSGASQGSAEKSR